MTLPVVQPMLASPSNGVRLSTLVGTHIADLKLDGLRAIAYWDGQILKLLNRTGHDITHAFPELEATASLLGNAPVILDGEIVALSGSFQDVARRGKQSKPHDVVRWAKQLPCNFMAFDCLWLGDTDTRRLKYVMRREILDNFAANSLQAPWQTTLTNDNPELFYGVVRDAGMEGIIAKRINSVYSPGRRSDWLKFKCVHSLTCVATGYESGEGARAHFGAMFLTLVGEHGELVQVGKVGTGFTATEITELKTILDSGLPIMVEIECLNVTKDGVLRHPVYKGIRTDLSVVDASIDQLAIIPRC